MTGGIAAGRRARKQAGLGWRALGLLGAILLISAVKTFQHAH